GEWRKIECDLLCLSGGWNPTVHLFSQSRGKLRYDDRIAAFVPVESFQLVLASSSDDERRTRRRAFLQQVKRHIDAVARYVAPGEGTIDLALLYVPAEN
ncbi:MAG: DNA recombination protein RmuC, partial [Chloroflexota bacterium]